MKKIMFNDFFGLTEAVLSGRKTQTRRIIPKSVLDKADDYRVEYYNGALAGISEKEAIEQLYFAEKRLKLPYKVGEVVAVAQAYKDIACGALYDDLKEIVRNRKPETLAGWTNKMFVRADLMPSRIRITNVRVERLQDISDEDCIKEGIEWDHKAQRFYVRYDSKMHSRMWFANSPRETYSALIDSISGKGTWGSNPYVFVYDFELVK